MALQTPMGMQVAMAIGFVVVGEQREFLLCELLGDTVHHSSRLDSMGEPARGIESTSTFAGMWRAETSNRGGC